MPYSNLLKRRQQLMGRAILFYQSAVQIENARMQGYGCV